MSPIPSRRAKLASWVKSLSSRHTVSQSFSPMKKSQGQSRRRSPARQMSDEENKAVPVAAFREILC